MMIEAKNEDMKKGYALCIAEMIAAQPFNAQEGSLTEKMYGVVTIGEKWKFMESERLRLVKRFAIGKSKWYNLSRIRSR